MAIGSLDSDAINALACTAFTTNHYADAALKRAQESEWWQWQIATTNTSVPQPSGRAEAKKSRTPEKKGNTMNLYASYTKTKGGYRAQITLDGDDVIWEGTEVHGEVRNDEGRLVDSGNAAAQREASELITSTFTTLLATPAKA